MNINGQIARIIMQAGCQQLMKLSTAGADEEVVRTFLAFPTEVRAFLAEHALVAATAKVEQITANASKQMSDVAEMFAELESAINDGKHLADYEEPPADAAVVGTIAPTVGDPRD